MFQKYHHCQPPGSNALEGALLGGHLDWLVFPSKITISLVILLITIRLVMLTMMVVLMMVGMIMAMHQAWSGQFSQALDL